MKILPFLFILAAIVSCTKVVPEDIDKKTRSAKDSVTTEENGTSFILFDNGEWEDTIYINLDGMSYAELAHDAQFVKNKKKETKANK